MSLKTAFGKLNGAFSVIKGEKTSACHSNTLLEKGKIPRGLQLPRLKMLMHSWAEHARGIFRKQLGSLEPRNTAKQLSLIKL